ncbi:MAG: aminoacyl-tRNA hydrolase [Candidatus Levybacteria bacterium]|nr:aminoacyl-tRNA hydrolase [Candidatus Levybacteria bacterium]
MKLIVGLGNPGEEHRNTRHNLGFLVVEQFLKDMQPPEKAVWTHEKKFKGEISSFEYKPSNGDLFKVVLLKPQTYMNLSGESVALIKNFYKIESEDIWAIHDDLDLPVGGIKIRLGGAAGGHHGVESVIAQLGTDQFYRFKVGIGSPVEKKIDPDGEIHMKKSLSRGKVDNYVLGVFDDHDEPKIKHAIKTCSRALELALEKDILASQNMYNTK